MNKAVFFDRDGTINIEKNYLYKVEEFQFIEGAPQAIKLLNDNGYKVIVITNQAGVARGYYTEEDVKKLHDYIQSELERYDAHIDKFYYCPHHPTKGLGSYKIECNCRKPKTGLYEKAIYENTINACKSYVVGDKITDLLPGIKLNVIPILVETGYGIQEKDKIAHFQVKVVKDVFSSVEYILSNDVD